MPVKKGSCPDWILVVVVVLSLSLCCRVVLVFVLWCVVVLWCCNCCYCCYCCVAALLCVALHQTTLYPDLLPPQLPSTSSARRSSCPRKSPWSCARRPLRQGQMPSCLEPFSPALPATHELWFAPFSRNAHRTGNEAQLLLGLVHIHVHVVLLARLVLLRVSRLFAPLPSSFLSASLQYPDEALCFNPTASSLGHLRSAVMASLVSHSKRCISNTFLRPVQTNPGRVRKAPLLWLHHPSFHRQLPSAPDWPRPKRLWTC